MSGNEESLLSITDALTLAERVVEMADRVKTMHAITPGAAAKSIITVDGTRFEVSVRVADTPAAARSTEGN